jgi:hypothetical protein
MSTQLVRKLLRATEDVGVAAVVESSLSSSQKAMKKRKRKAQQDDSSNHQPCSEEQVLEWHVQNLLALDRSMAKTKSRGKSKSNAEIAAKQLHRNTSAGAANNKKRSRSGGFVEEMILTNSRSAAIQKSKFTRQEPTFNKEKYQQEQKEKSLRQIAKLLQKEEKKDKKKKKKLA